MSRNTIKNDIANLDKELNYGLFMSSINKVIGSKVYLKDRFTAYDKLMIDFKIIPEFDTTENGKPIWINQCGEIAYGIDDELKRTFISFYRVNPDKTKSFNIAKRYWRAYKGEAHLFRFLTAVHGKSIFDTETDYTLGNKNFHQDLINDDDIIRKLTNSPYGLDSSVSGILYITPSFEEKIHDSYIPSMSLGVLKNINGDFSKISFNNSQNQGLYPFIKSMTDSYNKLDGYFNWNYIEPFLLKSTKKQISDI